MTLQSLTRKFIVLVALLLPLAAQAQTVAPRRYLRQTSPSLSSSTHQRRARSQSPRWSRPPPPTPPQATARRLGGRSRKSFRPTCAAPACLKRKGQTACAPSASAKLPLRPLPNGKHGRGTTGARLCPRRRRRQPYRRLLSLRCRVRQRDHPPRLNVPPPRMAAGGA